MKITKNDKHILIIFIFLVITVALIEELMGVNVSTSFAILQGIILMKVSEVLESALCK